MDVFIVTVGASLDGVFVDPRKAVNQLFDGWQQRKRQHPEYASEWNEHLVRAKAEIRKWLEGDMKKFLVLSFGYTIIPTKVR